MTTCGPYDASLPARGAADARCPRDWQVLKLQALVPTNLEVTVPGVNLAEVSGADIGDIFARLAYREHYTSTTGWIVNGRVTASDDDGTTFVFDVHHGHVDRPGLFIGEIAAWAVPVDSINIEDASNNNVPDSTDDQVDVDYILAWRHRVFVEIEPSNLDVSVPYPLSISEVRMLLRDECPEANFLLDDLEYTDKEVVYAIQRAVDYWNETPPPVRRYTPTTFPYRYHWGLAVVGQLMRQASVHKLRNWLPVSAGGISIQDQQNWAMYAEQGDKYWKEYREWVLAKKVELNIGGGFSGFRGAAAV